MKKFLAVLLPMCMLSSIIMACESKEVLTHESTTEDIEEVTSGKPKKEEIDKPIEEKVARIEIKQTEQSEYEKTPLLPFSADEVINLNVSVFPPVYDVYDLKNKDDIEKFIEYLDNLSLTSTENPGLLMGGGCILEFSLNDCTKKTIELIGNSFLVKDDVWYSIPYEEAIIFDKISSMFVKEIYDNNEEFSSIVGNVVSIKSFEDGCIIKCVVENSYGSYNIDCRDLENIIDTRGSGSLKLYEDDLVDVKYNEVKKNGSISANTIFILEKHN